MSVGACANCEATGTVGQPCVAPLCARRGMHFIPTEDAEAHRNTPGSQLEGLVGTLVGEFLILRRLGRGGFGRVLLGLQRPLYRLRGAVKVLELDAASTRIRGLMLEKFENEARTLAVLRHPNVVGLLQYGRLGDEPFLAMEYIPGGRTIATEIDQRADRAEVLDAAITQRLLDQVLRGLEAAHREGVIHRDLKPNNIMLETIDGDPWHVKIVDFGLAKDYLTNDESSMMIGTPAYMAPEQALRKQMGPWTDLYAVGVMAIEMLTGRSLFRGSSEEILHQKLAPPMLFHDVTWSGPLADALLKVLAPKPEDRIQSAAELRQALLPHIVAGAAALRATTIGEMDPFAATAAVPMAFAPDMQATASDGGHATTAHATAAQAVSWGETRVSPVAPVVVPARAFADAPTGPDPRSLGVPAPVMTPAMMQVAAPPTAQVAAPGPAPAAPSKTSSRRWLAGGGTLLVAAGISAFFVSNSGGKESPSDADLRGAPALDRGGALGVGTGGSSGGPGGAEFQGDGKGAPPQQDGDGHPTGPGPLVPRAVSAASFLPAWKGFSFGPANAADGSRETSWQPDAKKAFGLGQWLRIEFANTIDVERIEIETGFQHAGDDPDKSDKTDFFCANAAPVAVSVYPDGGPPWRGSATGDGRRIVIVPPDGHGALGAHHARTLVVVPDAVRAGAKWPGDLAVSEVRVFGAPVADDATDLPVVRGPLTCADHRLNPLRLALVRACGDNWRHARPPAACTLGRALIDACAVQPGLWSFASAAPKGPPFSIPEAAWKAGRVTLRADIHGNALELEFTRGTASKGAPQAATEWALGFVTCTARDGSPCPIARDALGLSPDKDPELLPAGACKSL